MEITTNKALTMFTMNKFASTNSNPSVAI